jgi:hypothetical protein
MTVKTYTGRKIPIAASMAPPKDATRWPMNATVMTTGPRGDHRDGHGVEELLFRQPAELLDNAPVEEGHDRQPAAEHERSGLREEQQHETNSCIPMSSPDPS